jgi:DNA-binding NtrC family response regulator/tRNA A-37 threonylcarbamoyl transferase component Bud32
MPMSLEEPACVLLVDDEPINLEILRNALDGRGYRLLVARNGDDALAIARRMRPGLVLLDVVMPGIDGYETCRRLKADPLTSDAAVIFLSALTEAREKVKGFEAGAVDFVSKPFQPEEVVARVHTHLTVQRLQVQLESRNADLARELQVAQEMLADARRRVEGALIGTSPSVRALRDAIAQHAASPDPLLLTGPTGAGQEAVARAIHHQSARGGQALIHVNCALIAPGQAVGLFAPPVGLGTLSPVELAERGTLFLEEIHRLPPTTQIRLADLLEQAARSRAEGVPPAPDIRVIATTSAPTSMDSGLSPRLLDSLEPGTVRLPSLAERKEDIEALARFFVEQHARSTGAVVERVSDESLQRMRAYRWPGNLREFESVLERAVLSARESVLEVDKALLGEGLPLGHYRLLTKLGEGGMGEVWRARHQLLARTCAVKLIRPDRLGSTSRVTALERFRREARSIARLSSPHTVRLYDFGTTESGGLFFAMELLDGFDLSSVVENFGPLPPERVVSILRQACRSLAEAHQAGLLHRDVKPQNLFLCCLGLECDVVKVLDFGLVKSTDGEDAQITAAGALTGTPAYMPPERVKGGEGDARSDIYALGCVAFWMLTGRTVFTGAAMAMVVAHANTVPERPSSVLGRPLPERLEQLVMDCLEKDPSHRPPTALDLWRLLGEVPLEQPWTPERALGWWQEKRPGLFGTSPVDDATGGSSIEPAD